MELIKIAMQKAGHTPRSLNGLNGTTGLGEYISQAMNAGIQRNPITRGAMVLAVLHSFLTPPASVNGTRINAKIATIKRYLGHQV